MTCDDPDDLFRKMFDLDYYSWFRFDLIEEIADTFCDEDAYVRTKLSDYKTHRREFCQNRLCHFPQPLSGLGGYRDAEPYVFKVDREWETMRLSHLDIVTSSICNVLKLQRLALFLQSIHVANGRVQLTYGIPQHVAAADIVFPLSKDQEKALEKNGIRFSGR